ncbi:unnamed protein product [Hymenolepis diminuta]|uniref:C2H2-type domain-containing protein n=1 Tax=Hymenolepis diminuta TaxID=6216 RepID=A0A564ZEI7_HYMDI|nr:unnamed protein product [Hymenolepis diminuta]
MSSSGNPDSSESVNSECYRPNEEELAQLLVKTLVPSFRKEIRLQALIAYQVDGENYRSLIVDRCFKRDSNEDPNNGKREPKSPEMIATSPLNDSGIECGDTPAQNGGPSSQPVSRRKRRFCRPCKIPQSPQEGESTPPKVPEMEQHLVFPTALSEVNETITPALMSALTSAAQLEPKHQVPILPNISISSSNKIIISPISAPKVTSSAITSTPRPILPRPITGTITSTPITTTLQPLASLQDHSIDGAESGENDDALASSRRYGKSFVCNQCKLAFLSLNSLCEHTYSQHKSFRCNFCGAQFTQRSNLQRHSLRHVGFKPFVCGVCKKEYYRKDHLVRHIEVTHPGTDAKKNIIVKLSSAECLDYLDAITQQHSHPLPNGQVDPAVQQEGSSVEPSNSSGVTNNEAEVPIPMETASSNAA